MSQDTINNKASFIWQIADLLRDDFKPFQYAKVILPLTILRRLDCLLDQTKDDVLAAAAALPEGTDDAARIMVLTSVANAGGQI